MPPRGYCSRRWSLRALLVTSPRCCSAAAAARTTRRRRDDDRATAPTDDRRPARRSTARRPIRSSSSTSTDVALLTGVRAAAHDGYDRVVFEFRTASPGYDVRYVEPPVAADGSGDEVAVEGGAVLVVRMEPALDADLTQESAPRTYTGPQRFTPTRPRSPSSSAPAASRPFSRGRPASTRSGRSASPGSRARRARDRRQELRAARGAGLRRGGAAC